LVDEWLCGVYYDLFLGAGFCWMQLVGNCYSLVLFQFFFFCLLLMDMGYVSILFTRYFILAILCLCG
jgi:hypothetical protein